ncbi:MAG: restriction endonuclease subunit S [Magnetococcales bacterium]|nr:restriction endonuclease subunit S [Magnetococcales bacterium]
MREVKLGDLFQVKSSKRVLKSQWQTNGVPFYRGREITALSEAGHVDNELFISEELYAEHKAKHGVPVPGDLLITAIGTIGNAYIVQPKDRFYFKDASVLWLQKKNDVNSTFINYWIHSPFMRRQIIKGVGTTVDTLTIDKLRSMTLHIPPLPEQKRIAAILDKADAIRRNRRQALALADQFLRAVFLDMFGDPVTNPKGWPVGTIRDLLSEVRYGTAKKADAIEGEFPVLRMGNITFEGAWDLSDLKYVDISEQEQPKYLAARNDILFNRTNSKELVGKTAVCDFDEPMAFAGYLIRARVNDRADPYYISGYLNSKHGKATLMGMCKNIVGMANINAQEMQDISIAHPPIDIQRDFRQVVEGVKKSKSLHLAGVEQANILFGSLTQRAFRGEL